MKSISLTLFNLLLLSSILSAQSPAPSDTSKYYEFHINYWINAHHFLWLEAFMNVEKDSTLVTHRLQKKDLKIWIETLNYYKKNLVQEDLRSSDYMSNFKEWIITQDESLDDNIPETFQSHVAMLQSVHPVYQKYFWPEHQSVCQSVIADNISLLRKVESDYVDQITTLTRQFWEFTKIRVDLTYVAKASKWNLRNRPYTSLFPTHVVMNAVGENKVQGNWIELLFHESAHHLILPGSYFVGGTINDYAESKNIKPPRQLWHAYLFYFTGQIAKNLLNAEGIDYPVTYMERNRVFSKYFPLLEKHLTPYMNREATLAEATSIFIREYNNGQQK
ncbi:MAG: hypothetical protein ABJH72_11250 [Reichenbachiella sp.]|uniref:hypothetical protein n=1 Tax=Reichenbachiella sp. TaxID=2184521 RepID=UPI003263AC63